jgi:hypothetical protein
MAANPIGPDYADRCDEEQAVRKTSQQKEICDAALTY